MSSIPSHSWFVLCAFTLSWPALAQLGGRPGISAEGPRAQPLPRSGRAGDGTVTPAQMPGGVAGPAFANTVSSSVQVQGAFQGSVTRGTVTAQPLGLSLMDAIQRGLQFNLGTIGAAEAARQARAQRLAALTQLLPDIFGDVRESLQRVNLAAQGFRISSPIAGFRFPTVLGPFNNFDARAAFSESLSVTGVRNWRSTQEAARSAELFVRDSRELVVLAVAGTYLQTVAAGARVQTARAQVETATAVAQQAVDRNRSGLNARIDVSRSQVELQSQQQRLTSLNNDFEKQKLALARLIGLPLGQVFMLTDAIPYREVQTPALQDQIRQAMAARPDVLAAAAQQKAAELARAAATAEYLPSLNLNADYGVLGVTPTNQARGTYTAAGAISFPIFPSGRIRADIDQADAVLAQRNAEYEDAKGRVEQDVRTSILDLTAASEQVKVADSSRKLAADTLDQARDRFRAGVADTVELVQAQELVATAEQDYISALFAFNLAQVSLARATGQAEQGITRILQGP